MSDLKNKEFDKTISLKIQEIESLKAQNGRLIERLQEEIDRSASAAIQKEIIHKEIIQIHVTMREVYHQGQVKNSALEKIYNKMNEFEAKLQEQQKLAATKYSQYISAAIAEEMEQLKNEVFKVQSKETNIERLILETNEQIQEQKQQLKASQLVINTILKRLVKKPENADAATVTDVGNNANVSVTAANTAAGASAGTPFILNEASFISDADMEKIEYELKNELSTSQEDLNLIIQMLTEKSDTPLDR